MSIGTLALAGRDALIFVIVMFLVGIFNIYLTFARGEWGEYLRAAFGRWWDVPRPCFFLGGVGLLLWGATVAGMLLGWLGDRASYWLFLSGLGLMVLSVVICGLRGLLDVMRLK